MRRFLAFSLATFVGSSIICCPHTTAQPASTLQQSASSPRKENKSDFALKFGKTIERQIAGREIHTYTIPLASGQFLHAVLEERGIHVSLVLFGPDGRKVAEGTEQPESLDLWGSKTISFIAGSSGDHQVQLQAVGNSKWQRGHYELLADERTPATENERNRVAATRLLLEAQQDFWKAFQQQSNEEAQKKAAAKYESSL